MTTDFRRCLCIHPKRTNYRAPFRNVFPVSISPKIYSSRYSVVSGGAGETFYNIKFFMPAHEQETIFLSHLNEEIWSLGMVFRFRLPG